MTSAFQPYKNKNKRKKIREEERRKIMKEMKREKQGIYIDEGNTEREKKNKKKLERYQTFSYKQAQHA